MRNVQNYLSSSRVGHQQLQQPSGFMMGGAQQQHTGALYHHYHHQQQQSTKISSPPQERHNQQLIQAMIAELSNQDPLYSAGVAATTTAKSYESSSDAFLVRARIKYTKELFNVKSKAVLQNCLIEAGFSAEETFEAICTL